MTKCANFVCLNKPYKRKGNKGNFCLHCTKSGTPMVFECVVCKQTFTAELTANLPKYCGIQCRRKSGYIRHGKEWSRLNYLKNKKSKLEKFYNKLSPTLLVTQI